MAGKGQAAAKQQAGISIEDAKKMEAEELFKKLQSSPQGLSSAEAEKRLERFGPNEIAEKKVNPILKFLRYFWGPIPWMVEVAVVLSAAIRRWPDFFVILALLMINALVGFWQERQAENAIGLLTQRLAVVVRVLRDGKWQQMPASRLVPGDMVRVRLGDIIPADIKLIEGDYLMVDQSALTGESLPVEAREGDIVYSGSIARQGEMNGAVVATGMATYFGRTASLVQEAKTPSHFQKAVIRIGDFLIIMAAVLVGITFIVALVIRHNPFLEQLQFALVLTIAAIPVALPAVLTVTMAVGAIALAKKEAIVSKLTSIEEMAGMNLLFADKTGTITKNSISVAEVQPFGDFKQEDVLTLATLASKEENQDPIDDAIIARASSDKAVKQAIATYKVSNFKPFDPVKKRAEATVHKDASGSFEVSKGAPQVILQLAKDGQGLEQQVNQYVNNYAAKGYRSLGVARSEGNDSWEYVGILALFDPPRDDSAQTIATAENMGLDLKMITGDHVAIAKEIAENVHLGTDILPASAIQDLPDDKAAQIIEKSDGFAEVFPEHKFRIVDLMQKHNHIVGMTGDGVNDAPALRKADAGIAVQGATDAAKSAADLVPEEMLDVKVKDVHGGRFYSLTFTKPP